MSTTIGALLAAVKITNTDGTPTAYFVRFINQQILDRLGGLVADSNTELADEIAILQGESLNRQSDPNADVALMGVDELRNELSSLRNDTFLLRQALWEKDAELLMLRVPNDLRARVEQLEDLLLKAA